MIFTKVDDILLEKIEDEHNDKNTSGEIAPHIVRSHLDSSYYAHLSTGKVVKCHNRATAEFYIRNEESHSGQKVHTD